jgi:hypothetical protein
MGTEDRTEAMVEAGEDFEAHNAPVPLCASIGSHFHRIVLGGIHRGCGMCGSPVVDNKVTEN